ncbi:MAG: signal recognition particle-docking protein FtsY [Verrucomicrobia bacterium CG_4_10_14_3_um_filter_43_23]|nr:MAG: signal recognition particle-docking protein FtsY [Verrucomicrobia bacterium CG1_02_43_26]PIP58838.1 MAG: signal recognition particle-docking protein FtsY [Verrucomicrobia bacterium CG22_combo_CG10-13_8_21_14_all_43_17]PIX57762.1 MAG: signal recognition particle-docking protein FtsY [Verrucomicrobia bacterium CG_4_10_14_3_um_filter_43_23]PIY61072.1 MAG: signal recognition particle-docking protein FtsY [Verrucomicrobia bacterium CG_4_10_14_0_8_um_filter_43_34]PJA44230.1 MAG: signal recogn
MQSLFSKFKSGLQKTTQKIFGSLSNLFGGKKLDTASIEALEEALYQADFGVETATEIIDEVKEAYKREKNLRGQQIADIAATVLKRVLKGAEPAKPIGESEGLEVLCLLGVNGVGKTTTAGKLGCLFKNKGYGVLLGACDTFRAAANEQIKTWSENLGIEIVASHHGADSAAVAYDAYSAAKTRGHKVLILDTAGRLHTKLNLMQELSKLKRVLQKQDPSAPHHSLLVVDGSLGSNSIDQARIFHEHFGLTGLIVTKLDGTSRGGALVGIYRELGIPIYYVGLGERAEDLQPFSVEDYVNALFDFNENA